MDLPRITDAPVTLHTFSGALAETSSVEADAEREALTALFEMSLATEGQLSAAMDGTITSIQSVNNEMMGRFQSLSAVNDVLNTRVIAVISQVTQLTNAAQASQEAHGAQIQRMHAQIAQLEQEKAEMLRQRNEEVAIAARRQNEVIQALTEAYQVHIEALNLTHASALATRDSTYTSTIATLTRQLTQSTNNHATALAAIVQKDEETQRVTEELTQTQSRLATVSASLAVHEAAEVQRVAQAQAAAEVQRAVQAQVAAAEIAARRATRFLKR